MRAHNLGVCCVERDVRECVLQLTEFACSRDVDCHTANDHVLGGVGEVRREVACQSGVAQLAVPIVKCPIVVQQFPGVEAGEEVPGEGLPVGVCRRQVAPEEYLRVD